MRTLTVAEASDRLGIKLNTLYGMVRRGVIRHARIRGHIYIAVEDVEAYEMDIAAARHSIDDEELVHQIVRKRLFKQLYVGRDQ